MSYYEDLQLNNNASFEEIKKSFRKLSLQYHPDKDPTKEEMFKKINTAYETLGDAQKRKQYDQMNKIHVNETHKSNNSDQSMYNDFQNKEDLNDAMKMFFNKFVPPQNHFHHSIQQPIVSPFSSSIHSNQIETISIEKEITLEEAFNGINKPLMIERFIYNTTKNLKIHEKELVYIKIPRGIDNEEIIEIKEKGNQIDGIFGNIKVKIIVLQHDHFVRKGLDLHYKVNISFKESLIGFERALEYFNEKSLKYKSPRGKIIRESQKKIIPGFGIIRDEDKGNLILNFNIDYPNQLEEPIVQFLEKYL